MSNLVVSRGISDLLCHLLRCCDVTTLGRFVTAAEKDDDLASLLDEIETVARTVGDAQFAHAFANRLNVTEIAKLYAADAGRDPNPSNTVTKAFKPVGEDCGLADFDHTAILCKPEFTCNQAEREPELTEICPTHSRLDR